MKCKIDENGTLESCLGEDKIFRIPDGVKKIAVGAFEDQETAYGREWIVPNKTLEELIVPSSVEEVGVGGFSGCRALRRIRFEGNGLRKIGDVAFSGCISLDMVDLPEGLLEIGGDAFSCLDSLRQVAIPRSVRAMGDGAFSCCFHLEHIYYRGTEEEFAAIEQEYAVNRDLLVYSFEGPLEAD